MKNLASAVLLSALTLSASAHAAVPKTCCPGVTVAPAMPVEKFASTVAMVDMLEIKLGGVAQTNAGLASIKKFGAYMAKSHTAINQELTKLAAEKHIAIPTALDAQHAAILKQLSSLKGEAFDKAYIPAMVTGHTQVLAMFKAFEASCTDPGFKNFAAKNTKVIANHLKQATKIQAEMKAKGLL